MHDGRFRGLNHNRHYPRMAWQGHGYKMATSISRLFILGITTLSGGSFFIIARLTIWERTRETAEVADGRG